MVAGKMRPCIVGPYRPGPLSCLGRCGQSAMISKGSGGTVTVGEEDLDCFGNGFHAVS